MSTESKPAPGPNPYTEQVTCQARALFEANRTLVTRITVRRCPGRTLPPGAPVGWVAEADTPAGHPFVGAGVDPMDALGALARRLTFRE